MMSYSSGESFGSIASSSGGEFEIARVLASLGNDHAAAVVESGGGEGEAVEGQSGNNNNNSWGFKGKRSNNSSSNNKRIKETSFSLHSSSPSPLPFDLNVNLTNESGQSNTEEENSVHLQAYKPKEVTFQNQLAMRQDQTCVSQEDCETVDVKMEDAGESAEHGPPHNGGRSRHNLTEAEKEARRLRRVLANRESARQTIRRRQAFHEELTRKAAELASENETLKRSKELAVKEFQSLQIANHDLKEQLSQTLGFKLGGENKGQPESCCIDNLHSANLIYRNLSATPFVLPTCVRPSDLSLSQFCNPSCMLTEQENVLLNINSRKLPLCILPCPVFLPMPNIKNNNDINQLSSLLLHDKDEGSSVDSRRLYSPCSVIPCAHNCHVGLSTDDKTGGQSQSQSQTRFSFSLDRGGESQQVVPPMSCSTHPSSTSMNTATVLSENRKQRTARKKENTVAGADARKKRKELMKLKSRIHCQLLGREDG